ncbi:acetyltransferase [Thalassospira lucentensis]|jgi:ribosomal protein S18 acetylase RimI-like enzyme|uniref:Acetyltransferase n=1 Tax=Thalassospira lucentensis TaxID=168935 RepID=A0A154L5C7_9PROT|nr:MULTISPECIES: GNAT family N-acetyltransferase [Thalassospira]KZB64780.1 acetyltransferase [Thalassospira lucentensis]MCH2275370.1 GNAT family N-acetyltransferase [Thalassospira sp.]
MIRPARPSDETAIRDCAISAYQQYVAIIGRKPAPMTADFAAQIMAGNVHIATDDKNQVVGFIVFYPDDDTTMMLENIAVMPDQKGRGIGKRLMAFCEENARQQGFSHMRLYTNEKMTANLSIYPHLGYVETGRRTENGFNRVYFEKNLSV